MVISDSLTFRLSKLSTAFKAEVERQLGEFDLHAGQVFILFELWTNDGLSQIELSTALNVAPPTIHRMTKNLIAGGFVRCDSCPSDARIKRVFLTDKGKSVRPDVVERWQVIEEKIYGSLTPTERLMLGQLFDKLLIGF